MTIKRGITASEVEIESFEKRHGIRLPPTYSEFMRKRGGGTPEPNCVLDPSRGLCLFVASIFPLSDSRMAEQRFPLPAPAETGFLAVGASGGGDHYLIDTQRGEVYYWDHERNDVNFDAQGLTWLARSVANLVDALVYAPGEGPEELDELETVGRDGRREDVDRFVKTSDIQQRNAAGRTLAQEAARYGNLAVIQRCRELGAPMANLLHFAAAGSNTELVRYLLDSGEGVNEVNDLGQTPLDRAIAREIYELLEGAGGVHAKRRRPPHLR